MKIVFLDIDGVMNPGMCHDPLKMGSALLPEHMTVLNDIVARSGAGVVVSSAFRMCHSVDEMGQEFREAGFSGSIVGKTPIGARRCDEIQTYLDEHSGIESFVILDDMSDMGDLTGRLVCTDPSGLMPTHAELALQVLGC